MNFTFGADIDALRRFLDQKHTGIALERAGYGDLLLIAAAQCAESVLHIGRTHAEALDVLLGHDALLPRPAQPEAANSRAYAIAKTKIGADRERRHDGCAPAIRRDEQDALFDSV